MKLSFWDILASMVMLVGLALATIFINIFINPYSFINPFPPPTPVASLKVPTLTPSQRSLPDLWTATPETPGVPSITGGPTQTMTITGTHLVLPTKTATRTRTPLPTATRTFSLTPNRTLTSIAYKTGTATATATSGSSSDTTSPSNPGWPVTGDPITDSTPTWTWTASTDSGSGMDYYQISWGTDIGGNNTIYTSTTNTWTTPLITTSTIYYIFVRAVDNAGNQSSWVGPAGYYFNGPTAPIVTNVSATVTSGTTATLNATINANGYNATVIYQWGLTAPAYAYDYTDPILVTGSTATAVSHNITGLTPNTLYHYRVSSSNAIGPTYGIDFTFTTTGGTAQTITFTSAAPGAAVVGGATYTPTATASSGLTVTLTSGSLTICTIGGGNVVTFIGAGTCIINANQAGNGTYSPAPQVQQSFVVGKGTQVALVAVVTPSTIIYGNTAVLSTTGGSGTGAVTFSAGVSTGCSVGGTTLSVIDASGSCDITATKATDANYLAATSASVPVTLSKANQAALTAISSPNPATYGTPATLSSSGGSGTGAVTFSDGGSAGCTVAGTTLTVVDVSQACQVTATKATDNNYNVVSSAPLTVTLSKAAAVITFAGAPSVTYGDPNFSVSASTTNTDSGALTYSQVSGPCTFSAGSTFTVSGAGTCVVQADGAATTNFNAASNTQSVTIAQASQTISFTSVNPSPVTVGGADYTVTANATSTLPVAFSVSGACTLAGNIVSFNNGTGPCTVSADQAGDANYLPAPQVQQSITVNP
jgi:hypothetical protein